MGEHVKAWFIAILSRDLVETLHHRMRFTYFTKVEHLADFEEGKLHF